MAATITDALLGPDKRTIVPSIEKVFGTGAPADADLLCTETKKYKKGCFYMDTAAAKLYIRVATAGVAADFVDITKT